MTNNNVLAPNNGRRPALIWAVFCLILLGTLLALLPGARMNSSVLAMLPKQALGDIPPALNDGFISRLDKQMMWLVSPVKRPIPTSRWRGLSN